MTSLAAWRPRRELILLACGTAGGRRPAPAADLGAARALLRELAALSCEGAESPDPRITGLAIGVVASPGNRVEAPVGHFITAGPMKRSGPDHPKTRALAQRLRIPQYAAVGLLELLFHFTAKYALQGDVGRHEDSAIARALFWHGDPGKLIEALTGAGWLNGEFQPRGRRADEVA